MRNKPRIPTTGDLRPLHLTSDITPRQTNSVLEEKPKRNMLHLLHPSRRRPTRVSNARISALTIAEGENHALRRFVARKSASLVQAVGRRDA